MKQIRESGDFSYELIGNMGETPAYLDIVPSRILDVKGKKTIKVKTTKSEKCHVTAVFLVLL